MISNGELVSVLICCYNASAYIEEAISSILEQTYNNIELIVINDASTDDTLNILTKISRLDKRIKLYNNEANVGLTKSLNKGIKYCQGKYIARMDSDDIARKDRIERQMNTLLNENSDICFSNVNLIDNNGNFIAKSFIPESLSAIISVVDKHCYIPHPTVIYKKSLIERHNGYNEKFRTGQDKELWKRLIKSNEKFSFINDELLDYRINPESVRKDEYGNYEFYLCNSCIWNNNKIKALKYMKSLNFKQKILIFIKLAIPFRLFLVKRSLK